MRIRLLTTSSFAALITAATVYADSADEIGYDALPNLENIGFELEQNDIDAYLNQDSITIPTLGGTPAKEYQVEQAVTLTVGGRMGIAYDDNVFRAPGNEQSDTIYRFQPTARLDADLNRWQIRFDQNFDVAIYRDEDTNDFVDSDSRIRANYEINEADTLLLDGRYRMDHIGIGQNDDLDRQAGEPTDFRYGTAGIGWEHDAGSDIFGGLNARYENFNYDNVSRLDATRLINDDRDRDRFELGGQIGTYIEDSIFAPYLSGAVNAIEYDDRIDQTAVNGRNSDGYELMLGTKIGQRKDDLFADLAAGLVSQDYDDPFFDDVDTLGFRANVTWRASEDFALLGSALRTVRETPLTGTSSYIQTGAQLRGIYSITKQWIATAMARYDQADFQTNSTVADRVDDNYRAGLEVKYMLTDNYSVGVDYSYWQRESDQNNAEFTQNQTMLFLQAEF